MKTMHEQNEIVEQRNRNYQKQTSRNPRAEELPWLKNSIKSFNSRLDQPEERISELEDRSFEIIQSEE